MNSKNNINGNNEIKNDDEEIISVERPFVQFQSKKSSRMVNNLQSLSKLVN